MINVYMKKLSHYTKIVSDEIKPAKYSSGDINMWRRQETENIIKKGVRAMYIDIFNSNMGIDANPVIASGLKNGQWKSFIKDAFPKSEIIDGSDLIQSLRKIKSREEINHIRQSASITDKGIEAAVEAARENSSDNYIAAAANTALIGNGSEYFSISPIHLKQQLT